MVGREEERRKTKKKMFYYHRELGRHRASNMKKFYQGFRQGSNTTRQHRMLCHNWLLHQMFKKIPLWICIYNLPIEVRRARSASSLAVEIRTVGLV